MPRWPTKAEPLSEEALAARQEDAEWRRQEREKYTENAKRWLTSEGKKEFRQELIETLMVNLQIERDEGQDIKPELEMHARACRKQVIETGNLLLEILDAKE
jgi:phosphopantetheinyl transferase